MGRRVVRSAGGDAARDEHRLIRYLAGDRNTIRNFAPVDSLYLRALLADPFLHTNLDRGLLRHYFLAYYTDQVSRSSGRDLELEYLIEQEIRKTMGSEAGIPYQAWEAFSDGRFQDAIALYRQLLAKKQKNHAVREDLGTALFLAQDFAKAAAELRLAIEERGQEEEKETVVLYRPKALLQHKLGLTLTRKGDLEAAKEAFGKALEAGRPNCRTAGGRTVYGGGGVYPDVVLPEPTELPRWLERVLEAEMPLRWAGGYYRTEAGFSLPDTGLARPAIPETALRSFRAFARAESLEIPTGEEADTRLTGVLLLELAAATSGDEGYFRMLARLDPALREVSRYFERAAVVLRQ